jgi:hypothetical protein
VSPFVLDLDTDQVICLGCGARIGNTDADKVEHLTTPSRARARARQKRRMTNHTTTTTETEPTP